MVSNSRIIASFAFLLSFTLPPISTIPDTDLAQIHVLPNPNQKLLPRQVTNNQGQNANQNQNQNQNQINQNQINQNQNNQNQNQATATASAAPNRVGNAQATPVSTSFSAPADAPAGGLVFTQPPATAAASYYKIAANQPLTFGWNYTNVLSFGNSITVVAYCSLNKISYTLSTLPAQATALTWDPYALQQQPGYPMFAEATYTLEIYDERGMGAGPTPGLMSPNSQLKFAMYKPQPYTPLASWTCSTCSGARGFFADYSPVLLACAFSLVTAVGAGWFGVLSAIR